MCENVKQIILYRKNRTHNMSLIKNQPYIYIFGSVVTFKLLSPGELTHTVINLSVWGICCEWSAEQTSYE